MFSFIEFVKRNGEFDFFSPIINLTGNSAVVAVGGISVGAVSFFALKALGFGVATISVATAIPVAIGIIGAAGAILGAGCFVTLCIGFAKGLNRHS